MSHSLDLPSEGKPAVPANGAVAALVWLLTQFNRIAVVVRYFLHQPTDWQDEAAVFMLVGMIFLSSAHVQSLRGHIGIEALAGLLSPSVNKIRMFLVDLVSCLFCAFFAWKSWTLFDEAWVDGQTTSSTFAPPLWIPYSMMALGMSVLTLQLLAQVLTRLSGTVAEQKEAA